MAQTPGVGDITMTTNGLRLADLARPLADAGLRRCNISLDSLNPARFQLITRLGYLEHVFRGIRAAEEAGLLPIKINCVIMRGHNDGEDVIDLARLTLAYDSQVRFIELMPFGEMAGFARASIVTEAEIQAHVETCLEVLIPMNEGGLDGEARLYRLEGARGLVGFISSVSRPFCGACSRARLTADGRLRLCLLSDAEVDLLTPRRDGASHDNMRSLIRAAIQEKPWGHRLADNVIPAGRLIGQIGG
jgi:cyclic pyranopterin phosphate synthase